MGFEITYHNFLLLWSFLAIIVFVSLFFTDAPYGRFLKSSSKLNLASRTGWIIMECPTVIGLIIFLIIFAEKIELAELCLCLIWASHYFHRTFIWPFRAKLDGKRMNLVVVIMAVLFNTVNVFIQMYWIFAVADYSDELFSSPIFYMGLFIFFLGMATNIKSDNILMKLRAVHGNGYHVPRGFLYKFVSSPNYLGEIIEWLGWAILTLSPAGLVFFLWTAANLIPRARSNHKWLISNVENYPESRKSIFPYIY